MSETTVISGTFHWLFPHTPNFLVSHNLSSWRSLLRCHLICRDTWKPSLKKTKHPHPLCYPYFLCLHLTPSNMAYDAYNIFFHYHYILKIFLSATYTLSLDMWNINDYSSSTWKHFSLKLCNPWQPGGKGLRRTEIPNQRCWVVR